MVKRDLEVSIQEYCQKAARQLPVCADWNGKRHFVTVRNLRDPETLMLELSTEFEDTAGVINDLLQFWNNPNASVFVDTGGGVLHEINGVGMETQNWSGIQGWQECVLIDLFPKKN
ncbi:MAG: hypothetical protein ACOVSW_16815 [Candidatus Kapaibacteriota bacterium]